MDKERRCKKNKGSEENTNVGSERNTNVGSEENTNVGSEENTNVGSEENTNVGSEENTNVGSEENAKKGVTISQLTTLENEIGKITNLVPIRNDSTGVTAVTDKEGNEVGLMKEYTFFTKHGKRETFKTFDISIITATERIGAALRGKRTLTFVIAKELSRLNNPETLKKMGFDNIADYAYCLFDLQKSTANQYARIGKLFINDDYRPISAILPSSLSVSHYLELLKYVKDDTAAQDIAKIEKAYIEGTIADGISTMRLRKALKEEFENVVVTDSNSSTDNKQEETKQEESKQEETKQEETKQDGKTDSPTDRIRKETAKAFSATIYLRDYMTTYFEGNTAMIDEVNKALAILDEASRQLLTSNAAE